jgi:xanthine phosphoribosyltransferase
LDRLIEKIKSDGIVLDDDILKVDSFINHNVDVKLITEIGFEFARRFKDDKVTKIATVESSGIAPALATAQALGVDIVFARKNQSLTLNDVSGELLTCEIFSFTKNAPAKIYVSKKHIAATDRVLIIDDFLANGEVCAGLVKIVKETGAAVAGIGVVIEKSFQNGREKLGDIKIESLARIASLKNRAIEFLE